MEPGVYMHNPLIKEHKKILLETAKQSISFGLKEHQPLTISIENYPEELQKPRATFVTLNINQQLRGCIGCLSAYRPLVEDVSSNAFAAAFSDPRFASLSSEEYPLLHYHISILSPSSEMTFNSEEDLLTQIQPGIDGLILTEGNSRGTFLPSVWEQLSDAELFLKHLKQKAGLSADYWSDTIKVSRYSVESFS